MVCSSGAAGVEKDGSLVLSLLVLDIGSSDKKWGWDNSRSLGERGKRHWSGGQKWQGKRWSGQLRTKREKSRSSSTGRVLAAMGSLGGEQRAADKRCRKT